MNRRQFIKTASGLLIPAAVASMRANPFLPILSTQVSSGGGGISAPTDISNCILWLDGSDAANIYTDSTLTTLVSADGDPVGGWKDKSGTGNSFIQGTSSKRPTYKTGIQNSKSCVLFDGTDDQLDKTMSSLGAHTVFIVARNNTTTTGYETLFTAGGASGFFFRVTGGGGAGGFVCDLYSGGDHDSAATAVNTFVTFSATVDGAGGAVAYKNAASFYSSSLYSSSIYSTIGGHGSEYLNGYEAEVVAFSRVLNSTELGQMETYLKNKWAHY